MNHLHHARSHPAHHSVTGRAHPIAPARTSKPLPAVSAALRQQQQVRKVDPCRDQQQREHQHGEC